MHTRAPLVAELFACMLPLCAIACSAPPAAPDADAAARDVAQPFDAPDESALDVPALDVPALDVPALDVPALDVPALDVPALDVPALDAVDAPLADRVSPPDVGSDSGGGVVCTPEGTFSGAPVTGTAGQWVWVDVPEAKCRNGSSTGFGVRLSPGSNRLVIYLEGGGSCFNAQTCSISVSSFGGAAFNAWASAAGHSGLLDDTNAENPLRGWNVVYIPYCTGDLHAGNAVGVNVPGNGAPQSQSFVGYANIGHDLQRIVPTFANVTRVLVAGPGAGGAGALFNYHRVAQAFCPREVGLVNDSGPLFDDALLAPCLQSRWRSLWRLDLALPAACAECTGTNGGGLSNLARHLAQRYPSAELGLVSSTRDSANAAFYGYGQSNCANIDGSATPLASAAYTAGLLDLRARVFQPAPARWSSYYVDAAASGYLSGNALYSTTVGGVTLRSWLGGVVSDAPAAHVGP